MLLIDQIVSVDESSIVCRKTFRDDEFFLQGHFPGQPIVPGVIQCECCLQAGALLLSGDGHDGDGDSTLLPVATRMDGVKFKQVIRPGDTVEIQVVLNEQVSNAYYMTGKMMLGRQTSRATRFRLFLDVGRQQGGDLMANEPSFEFLGSSWQDFLGDGSCQQEERRLSNRTDHRTIRWKCDLLGP